jgi:abortive infection bacteriophage resistance protein
MTRPWINLPINQQKVFFSLCVIKYFLDIIVPQNDLKSKIFSLLSEYPEIDTTAMGFPQGWDSEPLWR